MENWVRSHYAMRSTGSEELPLTEYALSLLKVLTIVVFIVTGIFVNAGLNTEQKFIGLQYWTIPGAPFVGGFGGFAKVFVTASFACRSS